MISLLPITNLGNLEMNSWGGNAEMAAIKDLYSVSLVVWQIDRYGVAHQINRINVGRADSRTLHIRWVNERHYETTAIPASYLPLPSAAQIPASEVLVPPSLQCEFQDVQDGPTFSLMHNDAPNDLNCAQLHA